MQKQLNWLDIIKPKISSWLYSDDGITRVPNTPQWRSLLNKKRHLTKWYGRRRSNKWIIHNWLIWKNKTKEFNEMLSANYAKIKDAYME